MDELETCLLVFSGLGAFSGKGIWDTMMLGKVVVVFVVISTVPSRLFLGLFTETGGFGEI